MRPHSGGIRKSLGETAESALQSGSASRRSGLALVFTLTALLSACQAVVNKGAYYKDPSLQKSSSAISVGSTPKPGDLAITSDLTLIGPHEKAQFTASGGTAPYVFEIMSGAGTIEDNTGLYESSDTASQTTVRVYDVSGKSADANITTYAALASTPKAKAMAIGSPDLNFTSLFATGGIPPFKWELLDDAGAASQIGSLTVDPADSSKATYSAPMSVPDPSKLPLTLRIRLTDSTYETSQAAATSTVTLNSGLTLDAVLTSGSEVKAGVTTIMVGNSIQLVAAGGTGGYNYSIKDGATSFGKINNSSGVFTASYVTGNVTLVVRDSIGNTAEKTLSVTSALAFDADYVAVGLKGTVTLNITGGVAAADHCDYTVSLPQKSSTSDATYGTLEKVQTPSGCNWKYTPPANLPSGSTSLTVTVRAQDNKWSAHPELCNIRDASILVTLGLRMTMMTSDSAEGVAAPFHASIGSTSPITLQVLGGIGPYNWKITSDRSTDANEIGTLSSLHGASVQYLPPKRSNRKLGYTLPWKAEAGADTAKGAELIEVTDTGSSGSPKATGYVLLNKAALLLGTTSAEHIASIAVAPARAGGAKDNIFITVLTKGLLEGAGQTANSRQQAVIVKINSDGTNGGRYAYASTGRDVVVTSSAVDGSGNFFAGGYTTNGSSRTCLILKLAGATLSSREYSPTNGNCEIRSVAIPTDNSGLYVTGAIAGTSGDTLTSVPKQFCKDGKVDPTYTPIRFTTPKEVCTPGAVVNPSPLLDYVAGKILVQKIKLDDITASHWGFRIGTFGNNSNLSAQSGAEVGTGIRVSSSGYVYLTGKIAGDLNADRGAVGGGADVFVARFSATTPFSQAAGAPTNQWITQGGSKGNEEITSFEIDPQGNAYSGGNTNGEEQDGILQFVGKAFLNTALTGSFVMPFASADAKYGAVSLFSGFSGDTQKTTGATLSSLVYDASSNDKKPNLYAIDQVAILDGSVSSNTSRLMHLCAASARLATCAGDFTLANLSSLLNGVNTPAAAVGVLSNGNAIFATEFKNALSDGTPALGGSNDTDIMVLELNQAELKIQ